MRIEKEDGWLEKHLGISGYSVLYHDACLLTKRTAHLTMRPADASPREAQTDDPQGLRR